MNTLEHIFIEKIVTQAGTGQDIERCICEAIMLSMKAKTNVILSHNNKTFTINYNNIQGLIKETVIIITGE